MNRIKEYYEEANMPTLLIKQKIDMFDRNKDIAEEFIYWIENKSFVKKEVEIRGFTASSLSQKSNYVNGEGAFVLMIQLRENPQKALERIEAGLNYK